MKFELLSEAWKRLQKGEITSREFNRKLQEWEKGVEKIGTLIEKIEKIRPERR